MKVRITDLAVQMDLGNKGVEFEVRDNNDKHLGDFYIGKKTIEWCSGRKPKGKGVQKTWEELIDFFT